MPQSIGRSRGAAFLASFNGDSEIVDEFPQASEDDLTADTATGGLIQRDSTMPDDDYGRSSYTQEPSGMFAPAFDPLTAQRQFAKRLIRKANFNEKLALELEDFMMLSDAEQRLAQFALSLKVFALLDNAKKEKADTYEVPAELKETAKTYSRALLLSPTITAYRGNLPENILAAMQDLNVSALPDATEVAQTRKVLKEIGGALTNFRSHIKDKIKGSLVEGSLTRNIADLTRAIISNTPIQVTLQHYIRFAFLRWCFEAMADDASDDQFWLAVDDTIRDIRSECKTEVAISRSFLQQYEADKKKYGDPADSETTDVVCQPRDVAPWQVTVGKHAANVLGNRRSKKRKQDE